MKSYKELEVWQVSRQFVVEVYRLLTKFPAEEKFALCDQIRRAVISVPSNIAEGFGRDTHKDFAHFLVQARGSLCEVETQLILAVDLGYIAESEIPAATIASISKMLSALMRHLRAEPAPSTKHQAPAPHQAPSTRH